MSGKETDPSSISRRTFMQASGAVLATTALTGVGRRSFGQDAEGEVLRIGLVGCGGRGTGAAVNALTVDPDLKLVAMGDVFADRLDSSLQNLLDSDVGSQVDVDANHQFTGFDAYDFVVDSCDVVLLGTPPHFRPLHLRKAVEAGKHVFTEKPVAVDAPGLRDVMAACELAREKGLSVVSGLCYRYEDAKQQLIQRVHDGAIGDIVALQTTYNTGSLWHQGRKKEWSDMEYQLRNWLYYTWLSGDHIVEQSIHGIDKILWAMGDRAPEKCTASGGRIARTDPKYGHIFDHFNSTFEWEGGVKGFHSCRQWRGADSEVSDYAFGTKGVAAIQHHKITGENEWHFEGESCDMYEAEMQALFASIRSNQPINDGDYMCKATLMAIMARMAAYTGKTIKWEQALNSKEDLTPRAYEWIEVPNPPVAQPGVTPFV